MSLSVTALLVLCALACVTLAQTRVDLNIIDPFDVDTTPLVIILNPADLPVTETGFTQDNNILGGERDLILTVTDGDDQSIVTSSVSDGSWSISTPGSAEGFSIMQYDGRDASSTLNRNGLGGVDFTSGGADSLHCFIQSDIETTYTFTIYSGSASSVAVVDIPGDDTLNEYFIRYSQDFDGSASFTSVGAFEIRVEANVDVDSFITIVATNGIPPASPTPLSPSPIPSVDPSASVPPSNSATPSPKFGFTWYTVDDDNGREPCEDERPLPPYFMDNENIIYYYFYGATSEIGLSTAFNSQSSGSILVPTISGLLALIAASLL